MNAVLPPAWALLTLWPLGFVAGIFVGRYSERHKETIAMKLDQYGEWFNAWYDRWVRVLFTLIGVLAILGVVTGGGATWVNMRQDAERDQLLACFDQYATSSNATSSAVRDASASVSEAEQVRDTKLGRALFGLVSEATDLDERVSDLVAANADLVSAQKQLAVVRKENPVPEPPSEFCAVQP